MMAFLVVHGKRADRVEAETPEDACLQAARSYSVWDNIAGLTFAVYPLDFHKKVRVQYEYPGEPVGLHEQMRDYGPIVVRDTLLEVDGYDRRRGVLA